MTNTPLQFPRMETIRATAKLTDLPEHFIRTLCHQNQIIHVQAGKKYLINVDKFCEHLNAPQAQTTNQSTYPSVIRKIDV